jgi:hypothetical protein
MRRRRLLTQSNGVFATPGLDEILSRLKVVETRGSTGVTCVLGGTTFTSETDIRSYITGHEIPSCALYWDLFSVMVCMGDQGLTGKERSDHIYSAERGRTGSALEGELVASMSHKRPLCLYGKGTKLTRLDEGFAMCKTYDLWIGSGNQVSYRQDLSTQILVYTNGILGQIGPPLTPAHHLAQVLLNQEHPRKCILRIQNFTFYHCTYDDLSQMPRQKYAIFIYKMLLCSL